MVLRVPKADVPEVMGKLWAREMVTGVYDPKWLICNTGKGRGQGHSHPHVRALAFTLSRQSPNYTGELTAAQYQQIFAESIGRYGTTLDYAHQTLDGLHAHGIRDHALRQLLWHAPASG